MASARVLEPTLSCVSHAVERRPTELLTTVALEPPVPGVWQVTIIGPDLKIALDRPPEV